ncbi:MAG: ATP-binding protein [Candidatus Dormibacterales bacterium]
MAANVRRKGAAPARSRAAAARMGAVGEGAAEALLRAVSEIASPRGGGDPREVAAVATEHARRLLDVEGAVLFTWEAERGLLEPLYETTSSSKEPPARPGQGMVGEAFLSGRPVAVTDYQAWGGAMKASARRGMRGAAAVPLLVEGRAIGVLGVWSYRPREFAASEIGVMELFAGLITPLLEAARLARERKVQLRNLQALHDVALAAGGVLDLGVLAAVLESRAGEMFGLEACAIMLWDEGIGALRSYGPPPGMPSAVRPGEGLAGVAFELNKPVAAEDYEAFPQALAAVAAEGFASAMAAPLTIQERAIGVLMAASRKRRRFTPADTDMLAVLAAQVAPAVEAARLHGRLAASEERYRTLYGAMACGVLVEDASGVIVDANGAAAAILGFDARDMRGRSVAREVPVPLWSEVGAPLLPSQRPSAIALRGGRAVRNRVVGMRSPTRGDIWLQIDAVPVKGTSGAVEGVVTSIIDITALKRAEAARRASREHLAGVVGDAPIVLHSIDRQGRITLAEGRGLESLGRGGGAALVGRSAFEVWPSPLTRAVLERALEAGEAGEAVMHLEATDRDLEVRARPSRGESGEVTGAAVVVTDVTERLRAQRELQASREQLAWLAANAPLILFALDSDGVVTLVEGAGLDALGPGAAEAAVGRPAEMLGGPLAGEHVRRALAGRSGRVEVTLGGVDFEVNYRPLVDREGRVERVIGVATDTTERRRAEEAVRESEAKSRFLAAMSHELRTPLNSVLGFAQLLRDQTFGPLSDRQLRYAEHIHSSGQHLLSLINDVLDLARVASGQMVVTPECVAAADRLAETVAKLHPLAAAKRLQVTLEAPARLRVLADPLRLDQVAWNLLSNAIKFTNEGGRVRVRAARRRDRVEISVSDTGIGIPAAELERIFDEFTQVETGTRRRHEGTGLGLALTRRLVALMDGTIAVESRPGRGSTFTVSLPCAGPGAGAGGGGRTRSHLEAPSPPPD